MEKSWNCVFEFLWEPCSIPSGSLHLFQTMTTICCCYMGKKSLHHHILINDLKTPTWMKVFRIYPEFRILSQPQNAEISR